MFCSYSEQLFHYATNPRGRQLCGTDSILFSAKLTDITELLEDTLPHQIVNVQYIFYRYRRQREHFKVPNYRPYSFCPFALDPYLCESYRQYQSKHNLEQPLLLNNLRCVAAGMGGGLAITSWTRLALGHDLRHLRDEFQSDFGIGNMEGSS